MATKKAKKGVQARGRGSITQRGTDRFLIRVFLGTDELTGKRKYVAETIQGTRKDAEKALTKKLRESDTNTLSAPTRKRVGEYLDAWLKGKRNLSPRGRRNCQNDIKFRIAPVIGNVRVEALTREQVDTLVDRMESDGVSPVTIHHTFTTLRAGIRAAIHAGIIHRNPCDGVELPKKVRTKVHILTPDEIEVLLKSTEGHPLHAMWVLALTTGLRPQEYLALQWGDFDGTYITVNKALNEMEKGRFEVGTTKTETSNRRVRLPEGTIRALEEHRKRNRFTSGPENFIFQTKGGSFQHPSNVRKAWHKALKDAGLPHARLYDLRHSHATHLLLAGKSAKVVSERLGHSSVKITMDTYTSVLPEIESDAVEAIDNLVFNRRPA